MPELLYRCKHCRTVYENKEEATKCENEHKPLTISDIVRCEYNIPRFGHPRIPENLLCKIDIDGKDEYALYEIKRFINTPEELSKYGIDPD
jgi:hypothetical protein